MRSLFEGLRTAVGPGPVVVSAAVGRRRQGVGQQRLRGLDSLSSRRYRPRVSATSVVRTRVSRSVNRVARRIQVIERRRFNPRFVICLGRIEQIEVVKTEYGRSQAKTIAQSPTHATGLQQCAEAAAVEHLSPMRCSLRAAPGLSRLRLLQRPAGGDGRSPGLISGFKARRKFGSLCAFLLY